jgi:ABC-type lipopolysaccharide export system ATPase subunit
MTNNQIKEEVFRKYGLRVESNQIIGIWGPQAARKGAAFSLAMTLAKKFIQTIGNYADALRMLRLAKGEK